MPRLAEKKITAIVSDLETALDKRSDDPIGRGSISSREGDVEPQLIQCAP